MKPTRHRKATLVDLLDRVLEKGVVISAEIVITLAGIPLIGINLRAAVAGMETMLKYGMMKEWDASIRGLTTKGILTKQVPAHINCRGRVSLPYRAREPRPYVGRNFYD